MLNKKNSKIVIFIAAFMLLYLFSGDLIRNQTIYSFYRDMSEDDVLGTSVIDEINEKSCLPYDAELKQEKNIIRIGNRSALYVYYYQPSANGDEPELQFAHIINLRMKRKFIFFWTIEDVIVPGLPCDAMDTD